jgi:predicted type IV restriction endonuclease
MSSAPHRIVELIETFDRNIETYHSPQYNETQLRREFIDPFFEELGWDVSNKQGYAQAYKEVIHEDAVKVGTAIKAPDYSFRIGGVRKFFLEAKKPSINIGGDPHPAYQLRRYAWSAKLPVSILTDFEEFAVYDCRMRPKQTDGSSTARIMFLTYKDYIDKWNEIADIFSREAVLKGSFDKFAVSAKGKRGTTTVDVEFLAELEKWRAELARIIALRNTNLSAHEINFAVQRTIDRIIFLRMCEDRGIEQYGQLQAISSGNRNYPRLCEVFERADTKYNSGLFHFHQEKGRAEPPDELTLNLTIDDAPLSYILHSLYYPLCPYEFSVLPAEILGNVYEQFLGSIIQVSSGRRTKIEPKPEVKKAGGIYYTPDYIVDYIVKNTVGRLLNDPAVCHCEERSDKAISNKLKTKNSTLKTPAQVASLRILDPACGSGSFLLGAYTYLLNYHRDWYVENNPQKYTKQIYQGRGGQWFLTIAEKKKILLNNIFGVDIDSQAVEVTKLSLLLKVLEGESQETLRLFHERALPDLGNNIKCGNSLIGPDFFDNLDIDSSDEELRRKINAFDWKSEFPEIFSGKNPGFHAIIGNPPYRSLRLGKKQKSEDFVIVEYLLKKLPYGGCYKINLFGLFMEKCVQVMSLNGLFSFIIPNLFFTSHYFKDLRHYLLKEGTFVDLFDLRYKVFEHAEIGGNGIFVFARTKKPKSTRVATADSIEQFNEPKAFYENPISFVKDPNANLMLDPSTRLLSKKLSKIKSVNLGEICTFYQGIITGNNDKFLSNSRSGEKWEKIIRGRDIERYDLKFGGTYVLYAPERLWSNTNKKMFRVKEKLISRQTSDRLVAVLDTEGYFTLDSTHVIHLKEPVFSLKYLLGIYNSKLLNFFYKTQVRESGRVFAQVKVVNLKPLPIHTIDFDNPEEKTMHDKMVKLVDRMLDLHKKLAAAKVPDEKTKLQRQISTTDSQIDQLVYDLYGLTDEEIIVVEGKDK